jgi:hypothetical protein
MPETRSGPCTVKNMGRMGGFEDEIPCVGGKIRIVKNIKLAWTEMSQMVFFTIDTL